MKLIDRITHLRSNAAFLFDLGKRRGHSPEQISLTIRPLAETLEKEINNSSIKERAMAVKSLEHQVEAHQLDKELIDQKIEDCLGHIMNIKNSLINDLDEKKVQVYEENGYTLTMIDSELIIR